MKPILIWDWDGTLTDSLRHKYVLIWDDVFRGEAERAQLARTFVRTPEGKTVNRYGIITHVLRNTGQILPGDNSLLESNQLIAEYAARYKDSATRNTSLAGLFPSVLQTLKLLHENQYRMYIVSGGGTDADLRKLAQELHVDMYFIDVYGFGPHGQSVASFGKEENIKRIMGQEGTSDGSRYVSIGDSESDMIFAKMFGMDFIGIANEWNEWKEKDPAGAFTVVNDVLEVVEVLEKRAKE